MKKTRPRSIKKQLLVLAGPTASGKTALAAELIKNHPFEIVSADSRQVYRGLDLGTGKDKSVPQHMIDVVEPPHFRHPEFMVATSRSNYRPHGMISGSRNEFGMTSINDSTGKFSVSQYRDMAKPILDDIWKRGKVPLIVGGTGYYIDALLYEQPYNAVPPSSTIRSELKDRTNAQLLYEIRSTDIRTAGTIDASNRVRLLRAVEIIHATKAPVAPIKRLPRAGMSAKIYVLDVQPRAELYARIDKRVDERLQLGMVQEVQGLLESGVPSAWLRSLGLEYRWITMYLASEVKYPEMVERLKFDIHAYARRQITYFKRWKEAEWGDDKFITKLICDLGQM